MFIRVNRTPNSPRKSIQICETYRKDGKVKQRIVHYVGVAIDEEEAEKLKAYGKELIAKITLKREVESKQQSLFPLDKQTILEGVTSKRGRPPKKAIEDILPPSEIRLDEIVEESRIVEGVHEVAGKMFDELYGELFKNKRLTERMKDIVLSRLVEPSSKHRAQKVLVQRFGKVHELDSLYRMMDKVYGEIGRIKQRTFEKTQALLPGKVDLLLFDVTTLYFESTTTDELRDFGYSKDHRFNTTQVVLALATNQDGLPVGYELFEGKCAEVTTLLKAITAWRQHFTIDGVCFVGDRAMFSKDNLALLEKHQCQYIVAAKLKCLPKELKAQLFDAQYYRTSLLKDQLAWIGEFEHLDARLIVSYKSKRALKDQKDRQKIVDKITKVLGQKGNPSKLISNTGVKQFITKDENASIALDEDKIAAASEWDGLHGVITNIKTEAAERILARYGQLWRIEESFRVNKHTLKMRPIYHWKPERIHAHIALCYMTFAVLRHLEYRVHLTQKISVSQILDALMQVQASIYIHKKTKDRYRLPGHFTHAARKIYKTFQLERSLDAEIYLP